MEKKRGIKIAKDESSEFTTQDLDGKNQNGEKNLVLASYLGGRREKERRRKIWCRRENTSEGRDDARSKPTKGLSGMPRKSGETRIVSVPLERRVVVAIQFPWFLRSPNKSFG